MISALSCFNKARIRPGKVIFHGKPKVKSNEHCIVSLSPFVKKLILHIFISSFPSSDRCVCTTVISGSPSHSRTPAHRSQILSQHPLPPNLSWPQRGSSLQKSSTSSEWNGDHHQRYNSACLNKITFKYMMHVWKINNMNVITGITSQWHILLLKLIVTCVSLSELNSSRTKEVLK